MNHKHFKNMVAKLAVTVSVIVSSVTSAHAGIMGDLNSMFMSNSTSAQTLSTRERVGFMGGSFNVRMPIQNVNVVAFDPARIDAGCGGIDLYGGSFSFVNSQQLIQIFRQVAANAAGLAFKAAISAISPSLSSLMTQFQTLMQNMNNLAKNSCSLAHLIVSDDVSKQISNAVNGDGSIGATSKGLFSDGTAWLQAVNNDLPGSMKKQAGNNAMSGNANVNAILASRATATLGIAGLGTAEDSSDPNSLNNQVLLAFLGYETTAIPCRTTNTAGNVNSPGATPVSCKSGALLNLDNLVSGGGVGSEYPTVPLQLYKCNDPIDTAPTGAIAQTCTDMQVVNFTYQGVRGWVNNALYGATDGSIVADSIMGRANSGSAWKPTAGDLSFIKQTALQLPLLFSKTSNPDTRVMLADKLKPRIINCVTANLGRALYKAANSITNNNSFPVTADAKKNIDLLRHDYQAYEQRCQQDKSALEAIQLLQGLTTLSGNSK